MPYIELVNENKMNEWNESPEKTQVNWSQPGIELAIFFLQQEIPVVLNNKGKLKRNPKVGIRQEKIEKVNIRTFKEYNQRSKDSSCRIINRFR